MNNRLLVVLMMCGLGLLIAGIGWVIAQNQNVDNGHNGKSPVPMSVPTPSQFTLSTPVITASTVIQSDTQVIPEPQAVPVPSGFEEISATPVQLAQSLPVISYLVKNIALRSIIVVAAGV